MMEEVIVVNQQEELFELPPGFRFHPTDEEIISCYLAEKVKNSNFVASAIGEADLNKSEPWDLPQKEKMGEKEWYLFCKRDRKYPTGMRTNRATETGYWKATGKDKEIYDKKQHKNNKCLIGMKKTLVFYRGRAPKGEKTNWVMHEYRLDSVFAHYNNNLLSSNSNSSKSAAKDEWVVCRVFHKNMAASKKTFYQGGGDSSHLTRMNSFEDVFLNFSPSLPPLMDPIPPSYGGYGTFADLEEHNDNHVKGKITAVPSSVPAYNYKTVSDIPYGSSSYHMSTPMATSTMLYPNIHHHHHYHPQFIPNPSLTFQPNSPGYYFKPQIRGQTIATSLTNNLGSQETGLSTANMSTTAERSISSSCVSKQENEVGSNISFYEHHLQSPSVVPISDIEGLWDYEIQN